MASGISFECSMVIEAKESCIGVLYIILRELVVILTQPGLHYTTCGAKLIKNVLYHDQISLKYESDKGRIQKKKIHYSQFINLEQ